MKKKIMVAFAIFALLVIVWWFSGHPGFILFEDGSWIIGKQDFDSRLAVGCLPGWICNVGH